jgi:hypothetical protein
VFSQAITSLRQHTDRRHRPTGESDRKHPRQTFEIALHIEFSHPERLPISLRILLNSSTYPLYALETHPQ